MAPEAAEQGRMPTRLREMVESARSSCDDRPYRTKPSVATWFSSALWKVPIPADNKENITQAVQLDRNLAGLTDNQKGSGSWSRQVSLPTSAGSTQNWPESVSNWETELEEDRRLLNLAEGDEDVNMERADPEDEDSDRCSSKGFSDVQHAKSTPRQHMDLYVNTEDLEMSSVVDTSSPLAPDGHLSRMGVTPINMENRKNSRTLSAAEEELLQAQRAARRHQLAQFKSWAHELTMHHPLVGSPKNAVHASRVAVVGESPRPRMKAAFSEKNTPLKDDLTDRIPNMHLVCSLPLAALNNYDAVSQTLSEPVSSPTSIQDWFKPEETITFIDWDDTLCPTSWISEDPRLDWRRPCPCFEDATMPLNRYDDDAGGLRMADALRAHEAVVIDFLRFATTMGKVVIVTLAQSGWVMSSIQHFMPSLATVFDDLDIEIVYAREALSTRKIRGAVEDGLDPWMLMKKAAMRKSLKRFYSKRPGQSWKNCLSIGDSMVEREALSDLAFTRRQPDKRGVEKPVRCKTVKLLNEPDVAQLTRQLRLLTGFFALLVQYDGDFGHDLKEFDDDEDTMCVADLLLQTPQASSRKHEKDAV